MMAPSPPSSLPMEVPSVIACRPTTVRSTIGTADLLHIQYTDTLMTDFDSDASVSSIDQQSKCSTSSHHLDSPVVVTSSPPPPASSFRKQQQSSHRNAQTVRVNVGGEDFCFPQSAFTKFIGLPWKRDSAGVYCLNSSAAVFEVLLDYTLFGTMPAYDTMSQEEFEEFETMALAMGGLTALIEHFDRKDSYLVKELRQGRSSKRRNSSGSSNRHFLINPEDSNSSSPNSVSATRVARFLGALCGVAETITLRRGRRSSSSSSNSNGKGNGKGGNCNCGDNQSTSSKDKKRVKVLIKKTGSR